MLHVLLLALGGGAGTLARYGVTAWIRDLAHPTPIPWGTVAVNLTGCLAFGLVWAVADRRDALAAPAALMLLVGFLGAFTTFSTFAFEAVQLLRQNHLGWAAGYLALQNALGMALVVAGLAGGRWLTAGG